MSNIIRSYYRNPASKLHCEINNPPYHKQNLSIKRGKRRKVSKNTLTPNRLES